MWVALLSALATTLSGLRGEGHWPSPPPPPPLPPATGWMWEGDPADAPFFECDVCHVAGMLARTQDGSPAAVALLDMQPLPGQQRRSSVTAAAGPAAPQRAEAQTRSQQPAHAGPLPPGYNAAVEELQRTEFARLQGRVYAGARVDARVPPVARCSAAAVNAHASLALAAPTATPWAEQSRMLGFPLAVGWWRSAHPPPLCAPPAPPPLGPCRLCRRAPTLGAPAGRGV